MKKALVFVLTIAMVFCSSAMVFAADNVQWNSQAQYPQDVVNTDYFIPVKILMDKKIITGDADGLFYPEKGINRAEFATIMAKATNHAGNAEAMKNKKFFTDLDGYGWAEGYINAAANANLIKGVGDGKYIPGREVTYAEVLTVILRATNTSANQILSAGKWPQNVISYVQGSNMLGSVSITDWNAPAKKGDVAKVLYRVMPKSATVAASGISIPATTTSGAILTVPAGAVGVTTTYQWYITSGGSDSAISGAIGNSFTVPSPAKVADKYYVKVTTKKIGYNETVTQSNSSEVK